MNNAWWITSTSAAHTKKNVICYRKEFELPNDQTAPAKAEILITAETRYKLFVNGIYAGCGPLRGDTFRKYYDQVDIGPYLRPGKNVLAVQVLHISVGDHFIEPFQYGPTALVGSRYNGLLIISCDERLPVHTDESYHVAPDSELSFYDSKFGRYAGDCEFYTVDHTYHKWHNIDFDSSNWQNASCLYQPSLECQSSVYGLLHTWQLLPRDIPFLFAYV